MPSSRIVLAPLFLWALAAGCSSTTAYRRPTSSAEAAQLLARPGSSKVEMVVESPRGPEVHRGVLAPFDGSSFVMAEPSGQSSRVLFQDVRSISYRDHGKGAARGFVGGAIPGFLTGFAFGSVVGRCPSFGRADDSTCSSSQSLSIGMVVGVALGLVSGGVGALIGGVVGQKATLTF